MKELILYFFQGVLILGVGVMWVLTPKVPQLAIVDMNALISKGSAQLAKDGKTGSQHVQQWGAQLKEELETYAHDHQIVLLAKAAVLGGALPDVTDEFFTSFENGEK